MVKGWYLVWRYANLTTDWTLEFICLEERLAQTPITHHLRSVKGSIEESISDLVATRSGDRITEYFPAVGTEEIGWDRSHVQSRERRSRTTKESEGESEIMIPYPCLIIV
jgi:hypothetical protein